ncbi:fibronectin-binding protein RevA [Borreliella yangtzensis]|uniref:Fe2+ transport system protein B n=1 Tax=Borreliella yangtzensis TaxID=683292 RepID=A0ABR6PBY0_9SPIR|nr:Fe2+ transport system protein B [Borreliella yangtzensis]
MEIKNIVKLFCLSILVVMACNLYVEEKKGIDAILAEILAIDNKTGHEKFKDYKDRINELKKRLKDVNDADLKEKLLKLQSLFEDKLAAKLAALKAAKQKIESITETDNNKAKMSIWAESKLVGVTIAFKGSYATGKGKEMSKEAVEQIDKIIKFLEGDTN